MYGEGVRAKRTRDEDHGQRPLHAVLSTPTLATELDCSTVRVHRALPAGGRLTSGTVVGRNYVAAKLGKTSWSRPRLVPAETSGTEYVIGSAKDGLHALVNSNVLASLFLIASANCASNPSRTLSRSAHRNGPDIHRKPRNQVDRQFEGPAEWSGQRPDGLSYGSTAMDCSPTSRRGDRDPNPARNSCTCPIAGVGQATTDMISGRLDFGSFGLEQCSFVTQGQIKVVSVVQPKRPCFAPAWPTTAEQGMPDMDRSLPFMFFAPGGTARPRG